MNTLGTFLLLVNWVLLTTALPNTASVETRTISFYKRSLSPVASVEANPFSALIVAGSQNNSIEVLCSGSILNTEGNFSHILTTAYCIMDRVATAPPYNPLSYLVLIPDPAGQVTLGSNNSQLFSAYTPSRRILHPNRTALGNYSFNATTASGQVVTFNTVINENDVGIIRLDRLITSSVARPIVLSSALLTPGERVDLVGYGSPNFFQLHRTDSTRVISSGRTVGGSTISDGQLLFFQDGVNAANNLSQGLNLGDEGGPLVQTDATGRTVQVGIGQGTWVSLVNNGTTLNAYASFGPTIFAHMPWILSTLSEPDTPNPSPTSTPTTDSTPTPTDNTTQPVDSKASKQGGTLFVYVIVVGLIVRGIHH